MAAEGQRMRFESSKRSLGSNRSQEYIIITAMRFDSAFVRPCRTVLQQTDREGHTQTRVCVRLYPCVSKRRKGRQIDTQTDIQTDR